jgi:sec-independent protein translocase protein TatC
MSFWDHLEELRGHIIRSVLAVMVFSVAAFVYKRFIFDYIILAPKSSDFITNRLLCWIADRLSLDGLCLEEFSLKIINVNMSGQFMVHMYISILAGLVLASPYVIWELWRFVRPALHEKEKKHASGAVLVSASLFILGVLFAYFILVPLTVNFFGTYQVSDSVVNQFTLSSYVSTFNSVILSCGIIFELPVVVYFLSRVGILTPAFMKRNRKVAIVIILILSAIITPPDIFSQIIVSVPLLILYETSIFISVRGYGKSSSELAG